MHSHSLFSFFFFRREKTNTLLLIEKSLNIVKLIFKHDFIMYPIIQNPTYISTSILLSLVLAHDEHQYPKQKIVIYIIKIGHIPIVVHQKLPHYIYKYLLSTTLYDHIQNICINQNKMHDTNINKR